MAFVISELEQIENLCWGLTFFGTGGGGRVETGPPGCGRGHESPRSGLAHGRRTCVARVASLRLGLRLRGLKKGGAGLLAAAPARSDRPQRFDAPPRTATYQSPDRRNSRAEEALGTRRWLAGDAFSMADLAMARYVNRLPALAMEGVWTAVACRRSKRGSTVCVVVETADMSIVRALLLEEVPGKGHW